MLRCLCTTQTYKDRVGCRLPCTSLFCAAGTKVQHHEERNQAGDLQSTPATVRQTGLYDQKEGGQCPWTRRIGKRIHRSELQDVPSKRGCLLDDTLVCIA